MRIVIDLQACQNGSGLRGIGRYAMSLTKAMLALAPQHDFRILLSDRFPGTIEPIRGQLDGILPQHAVVVFTTPERTTATDPANAWRSRAAEIVRNHAIEVLQPDLVFVPSLFEGFWDDMVVSVEPAPHVTAVTLHDLIPLAYPDQHLLAQADRDAYYRKLQNLMASDLILAVSTFVEQEAIRLLALPADKITHTLEGVSDLFRPQALTPAEAAALSRRYGIARPFVLNISPFEFRKNIEGMIAGFASLPVDLRKRHQLVIVGKMDGYARDMIARQVKAEGLAPDDVVLAGRVPDDDLALLFATCELFVFPSLSEGFGLPALEAMACGAAAIGSDTTSIPEVIGRDDALFDPREPGSIAATMQRFLGDAGRLAELRDFGLRRARTFSWERVAERTLAAFEEAHRRHRRPAAAIPSGFARPRLAFVTPTRPAGCRTVAVGLAMLRDLATLFEVTVVSLDGEPSDDAWVSANFEVHGPDWLAANGRGCDRVLFSLDTAASESALKVLRACPGAVLLHEGMDAEGAGGRSDARTSARLQRDLFAAGGFAALLAGLDRAPADQPADIRGRGIGEMAAGLIDASGAADVDAPSPDGRAVAPPFGGRAVAPPFGVRVQPAQAEAMRRHIGIDGRARLVVALVATEGEASLLTAAFRQSAVAGRADWHVLIHVADPDGSPFGARRLARPVDRTLPGRLRIVYRPLQETYMGLMAAADAVVLSSSYPAPVKAMVALDAAVNGRPLREVEIAPPPDAAGPDGARSLEAGLRALLDDAGRREAPEGARGAGAWATALAARDAMDRFARAAPQARYREILASFPKSVRGVVPTSDDVAAVVRAIVRHEELGRSARVLLDVTTWAAPGKRPRVPAAIRSFFLSFVASHRGRAVEPVFFDGAGFVCARQFFAKLIGLPFFAVPDGRTTLGAGDRIIGLDILTHIDAPYEKALLQGQEAGATYTLIAVENLLLQRPDLHGPIAALAAEALPDLPSRMAPALAVPPDRMAAGATLGATAGAAASSGRAQTRSLIRGLRERGLRPAVLCVDPRSDLADHLREASTPPQAWCVTPLPTCAVRRLADLLAEPPSQQAEAAVADLHYLVTGHVQGTYSLAIINRAVARVLETGFPGKVRFAPVETVPVARPEHVPDNDRALIDELVHRPQTAPLAEVVISQHYPLLVPTGEHRLALALFAWEESRVPAETIATLAGGFDGVIAPSQFVAKALIDSGLSIPIAAIGQPTDVDAFRRLGDAPRAARTGPLTVLHVSSCFPRKGVDILLAAWEKAFSRADDVRLIIKTFPNPHNTVEADVAALMARSPKAAPITIVMRDLDGDAMASLYREADVMVLPSRGEGYNLPALEAMLAGIPLIVTGYGGHTGFCGPEEARFIQYRFAPASSHVSGATSLWIEPDQADLVAALREFTAPAQRPAIERRRLRARVAALAACDEDPWLLRLQSFVAGLMAAPPPAPRVAWVSTWKVKCGVAEYSDYLLGATSAAFRENTVVVCDMRTAAGDAVRPRHRPVWLLGQQTDPQALVDEIAAEQADAVVLQHQDGLISWENLSIIAADLRRRSIISVIVLHNARNLTLLSEGERRQVVEALEGVARILVHNLADVNSLTELGLARNTTLFPHGAAKADKAPPIRPLSAAGPGPIIGCHGFFLPHKGIGKLIRAVAVLRKTWPNVRLRLVNARFPDIVSDRAIADAERLAQQLGIGGVIEWHTEFLPVETVRSLLSGCDLLVLPYDESADSASGAARVALSSLVPLLATRVRIFAEFDGIMASVANDTPEHLAKAMDGLLADPDRRLAVQTSMMAWLDQHDWGRLAGTLEGMIEGLVAEKHYRSDG